MKKLSLTIFLLLTFINLMYAQDGPNTWSTSLSGAGQIWASAVNPANQDIMYAGSSSPTGIGATGIWKTTNAGVNWIQSNSGLTNITVQAIAISTSNPNVLYCGTSHNGAGAGIYKSTDAGATWSQFNTGITETSIGVQALAIDPGNPDIAYVAIFNGVVDSPVGVYKTTNGGTEWDTANTGIGPIKNFLSLIINPLNPNVLYCGSSFLVPPAPPATAGPQKIYKSVDAAANWTDVSSGLPSLISDIKPVRCLSMSTADTSVVLAGLFMNSDTLGGMYLTTNGGGVWVRRNNGLPSIVGVLPRSCLIQPGSTTEFFAGLDGAGGRGVFRTTNAGLSWTDFNGGTLASTTSIRGGLNYKTNSQILYAGGADPALTSGQGVFEYTFIGTLNITMIMEGFYDPIAGNMRQSDTATAYFRNSTTPFALVDSGRAVIDANTFSGSFQMRNAPGGTYYIVMKHRNSIETWSATAISYTMGGTIGYNFITAASQAFGNNMKQVEVLPARFGIYSGDIDQQGFVDVTDLSLVFNASKIELTGYVNTDVTGDNFVDGSDLSIVYNNLKNEVSYKCPICILTNMDNKMNNEVNNKINNEVNNKINNEVNNKVNNKVNNNTNNEMNNKIINSTE